MTLKHACVFCIQFWQLAWPIVANWKWPTAACRIHKRMPRWKPITAATPCGWSTVIRPPVACLKAMQSIILAWSDRQRPHVHTKCCNVNRATRKVHVWTEATALGEHILLAVFENEKLWFGFMSSVYFSFVISSICVGLSCFSHIILMVWIFEETTITLF